MPSTATITAFYTFSPGTKARSGQVNTNFSNYRGHNIPIAPNTATAITDTYDLGSTEHQWNNIYLNNLPYVGGVQMTDPVSTNPQNYIKSARTEPASFLPQFIVPDGSAASCEIRCASTTLEIVVNGTARQFASDITITGLTPASTGSCVVDGNSESFTSYPHTKWLGEYDYGAMYLASLTATITDKTNQIIALKHADTTTSKEILVGYLATNTAELHSATGWGISNCYRGYAFNESLTALTREEVQHSATLELINTGWIFLESAASYEVSYSTPQAGHSMPAATSGAWWYDLDNQAWYRESGGTFTAANHGLVGCVFMDGTACIGARSFDTFHSVSAYNTVRLIKENDAIVRGEPQGKRLNVYGTDVSNGYGYGNEYLKFDMSSDIESGYAESASTWYFAYVTEDGAPKLSPEKPYHRLHDLGGMYHPYHAWRCVGRVFNNSNSNIMGRAVEPYGSVLPSDISNRQIITSSSENPGIGGIVQSGNSGSYSSSSGSEVVVTNLTTHLTTKGNPVSLKVVPSGSNAGRIFGSAGTTNFYIKGRRYQTASTSTTFSRITIAASATLESPEILADVPAGTWRFFIQIATTGTINVTYCTLIAEETT